MGRESRANPLQGGLALAKNYMGVRSAHFKQMDVEDMQRGPSLHIWGGNLQIRGSASPIEPD